jgi:N,N'-diacetyllegionaminate synthase
MNLDSNQGIEIVAELGSVHDGSIGNAVRLIECAAEAGATTAKFQLHIASAETTRNAPNPGYFTGESRYEYFERISFSDSEWITLREKCHSLGLKFGCSAFSVEAIEFLVSIGVDILKIPSGEITNHPLLEYAAKVESTIHLSSGMSNWQEIDAAYEILRSAPELCVMQCTSLYPAPPSKIGLNVITEMRSRFEKQNCTVGFSDHSTGTVMPMAAVALGARVIEKHLTFSRKMYGSDAFNALEPHEFHEMSAGIRAIDEGLRNPVDKNDLMAFEENRKIFQKSIIVMRALKKGDVISLADVKFLKPGTGIQPSSWVSVNGRELKQDIDVGDFLSFEHLV